MPHELIVDSERIALQDVVDVGRGAGAPLFRLLARPGGDAIVIATTRATRDGRVLLGGLDVIGPSGALLRAGRVGIELAWRAASVTHEGRPDCRCRLCFGAFAADDVAVTCACCDVVFHLDCDQARIDCVACGAPRKESSR